jgi:multiple sugar transport system substrate-binding protein
MMPTLRRLLLYLFVTVLLTLLVACYQSPSPMPETEAASEPTATPSPENSATASLSTPTPTNTPTPVRRLGIEAGELRGAIIQFWYPWSGAAGAVIRQLVDEFNLSNEWRIMVVPVQQGSLDELDDNVTASLATGHFPNLAVSTLYQALAWDAAYPLVDLKTYVEDPSWGLSPLEQADFYPVFWRQDVVNDRRLGIPAQRSGQVLYYNRTWARFLGYPILPTVPQQFREQACAAARANRQDATLDNDGTGGWIISTNYSAMLGWIDAFGGDIVKANPVPGASLYQFDNSRIDMAFTYLRKLFDDGCAWLAESEHPEAEFASRLGLFATGRVTDIPYQMEAFRQAGNTDEWTVIPFPSPDQKPAFDVYGQSFVMLPSSPERQLATWMFIKWLVSSQNHARLIEATGAFPLRVSALEYLTAYQARHPQWAAAVDALQFARTEPPFQSWSEVRFTLGDASTQLFRSYFAIDQVPLLLDYLDRIAAELQLGPEASGVYDTPTKTPEPSATPTKTSLPTATATITIMRRYTPTVGKTPSP